MSTPRQHAYTGPELPQIPEPSHAERARTLLQLNSIATLSTISRKQAGFPFGSLMPYALDEMGRPVFLISNMAMHTQNLKADARASLFVTQPAADGDPLGAARVTLVGNTIQVAESDKPAVRALYLARHENSKYWVDFSDFAFFRMDVVDLYYVGGFGVMGWVQSADYVQAEPDPLANFGAGIVAHMNADHEDSMILLARIHAQLEATEASMTSVDRLGFYLRLKTADGYKGTRIAFPHEVADPNQTRAALVQMVREARS